MLLYYIDEEGTLEIIKKNENDKLDESELNRYIDTYHILIGVSYKDRFVYSWIGLKSVPKQRFSCARETRGLGISHGYKQKIFDENAGESEKSSFKEKFL